MAPVVEPEPIVQQPAFEEPVEEYPDEFASIPQKQAAPVDEGPAEETPAFEEQPEPVVERPPEEDAVGAGPVAVEAPIVEEALPPVEDVVREPEVQEKIEEPVEELPVGETVGEAPVEAPVAAEQVKEESIQDEVKPEPIEENVAVPEEVVEAPKESIQEEVEEDLGEPAPLMAKNKSAIVQQWEEEIKADQEEEEKEEEAKELALTMKRQQTKKEVEDWQYALENEPQSVMQTEQSEVEVRAATEEQPVGSVAEAPVSRQETGEVSAAVFDTNTSAVARD